MCNLYYGIVTFSIRCLVDVTNRARLPAFLASSSIWNNRKTCSAESPEERTVEYEERKYDLNK
jgi:hypothetical protein